MLPRIAAILMVCVALVVAACGDDDDESASVSTTTVTAAADDGTEPADADDADGEAAEGEEADSEEIEALREEVAALSAESTKQDAEPSEAAQRTEFTARHCGYGVYAKTSNTSCAFALNVASDFHSTPSYRFFSYSPVTGQTYLVRCSRTWPSLCRAGNGARILITR